MFSYILNYLFPPVCPHCGSPVVLQGDWCPVCFYSLCHIHKIEPSLYSSYEEIWILASYEGGIRSLLHDLKFNHKKEQALGAAPFLQTFTLQLHSENIAPDYVIPVPVSAKTRSRRGYNQVDEIFKSWVDNQRTVNGENKWVWFDCFGKEESLEAMWQLGKKERREHVAHQFYWKFQNQHNRETIHNFLKDKEILVVDDIYTTGATLEAIGKLIQETNCKKIKALTLASGSF